MWIAALAVLAAGWIAAAALLWPTTVPDGLQLGGVDPTDHFTPAQLERARDYSRFVQVDTLLAAAAVLGVLWGYARKGAAFARESAAGRIGTGMMLAILGIALAWLAQVPFGLAGLWWDRRHDISKVGYLDWIVDSWVSLAGEALGISLSVLIVMALAGVFRTRWWLPAAPAFVAVAALVTFVSPFLIPDLNDLNRPALAADARRLERTLGVGDIPVKVQHVRKFTTAPNAEATGLGPTRRVILWDTLLDDRFTRDQVRVVLAHELGHHERRHLLELLAWFGLFALPGTFVIATVTQRRGGMYRAEAVPLALFVVVALQFAALPIQNTVTRRLEAEADWISLQATRDPEAARGLFERLAVTSLAEPDPPTWSYLLFDNHPTIVQRIAMANEWQARQDRAHRPTPVASRR